MKNIQIKHVPLIAFCLAFLKGLAFGVTWQDVGLAVVVSSLAFLYEFKVRDKEIEEVHNKFKELEKTLEEQRVLLEENRQYIANIKLNNTTRRGNNGFGV